MQPVHKARAKGYWRKRWYADSCCLLHKLQIEGKHQPLKNGKYGMFSRVGYMNGLQDILMVKNQF